MEALPHFIKPSVFTWGFYASRQIKGIMIMCDLHMKIEEKSYTIWTIGLDRTLSSKFICYKGTAEQSQKKVRKGLLSVSFSFVGKKSALSDTSKPIGIFCILEFLRGFLGGTKNWMDEEVSRSIFFLRKWFHVASTVSPLHGKFQLLRRLRQN